LAVRQLFCRRKTDMFDRHDVRSRLETVHRVQKKKTNLVITCAISHINANGSSSTRQSAIFQSCPAPKPRASQAVTSERVRRRGSFLRRVDAGEYSALRGKPQIEMAIWRYSTWIDESTDACFVSTCLKENIHFVRDDRPG